jgi:hypothetical protein
MFEQLEGLGLPVGRIFDILSALRGPDINSDLSYEERSAGYAMKAKITTRIRHIVYPDVLPQDIPGDITDRVFDGVDLRMVEEALPTARKAGLSHYLSHLYYAVYTTKDHEIWGGLGNELCTVLTNDR